MTSSAKQRRRIRINAVLGKIHTYLDARNQYIEHIHTFQEELREEKDLHDMLEYLDEGEWEAFESTIESFIQHHGKDICAMHAQLDHIFNELSEIVLSNHNRIEKHKKISNYLDRLHKKVETYLWAVDDIQIKIDRIQDLLYHQVATPENIRALSKDGLGDSLFSSSPHDEATMTSIPTILPNSHVQENKRTYAAGLHVHKKKISCHLSLPHALEKSLVTSQLFDLDSLDMAHFQYSMEFSAVPQENRGSRATLVALTFSSYTLEIGSSPDDYGMDKIHVYVKDGCKIVLTGCLSSWTGLDRDITQHYTLELYWNSRKNSLNLSWNHCASCVYYRGKACTLDECLRSRHITLGSSLKGITLGGAACYKALIQKTRLIHFLG